MTPEEFDEILDAQDGGCAICEKTTIEEGRNLAVDHDHRTGEIRGLLCYNCNRGMGHLQDDPYLLIRAAKYLEEYNATSSRCV